MRWTCLVAAVATAAGSWLKVLGALVSSASAARYCVVMLGAMLGGISQPVLLNIASLLSSTWFPPSQRDFATSIGALIAPVGNAAISVLSPLMVGSGLDAADNVVGMLLMVAGLCTAALIACVLWLGDAPPTPPSHAAVARRSQVSGSGAHTSRPRHVAHCYMCDVSDACAPGSQLDMLRDRDMLLLTVGFGIGAAMFNAVIALMGAMLRQRG